MLLHWPQITYIVLTTLGIGVKMQKVTASKQLGDFAYEIIGLAITYALLICGGFFG